MLLPDRARRSRAGTPFGSCAGRAVGCDLIAVSTISAQAADTTIASRNAKVDGMQRHWLAAGPRLSLILLHGYAETSRMLRPIIPLLAKKFAITAPDLADIGDSAIPESGIDRLTSAKRVHAPARSLGGEKARVVGHDIGFMVACAYASQFHAETRNWC
jgi:pimeloyl-ACP methyl ester carboxylesterase